MTVTKHLKVKVSWKILAGRSQRAPFLDGSNNVPLTRSVSHALRDISLNTRLQIALEVSMASPSLLPVLLSSPPGLVFFFLSTSTFRGRNCKQ